MKISLARLEKYDPVYASDLEEGDIILTTLGEDAIVLDTTSEELPPFTLLVYRCGEGVQLVHHFNIVAYRRRNTDHEEGVEGDPEYWSHVIQPTEAEQKYESLRVRHIFALSALKTGG